MAAKDRLEYRKNRQLLEAMFPSMPPEALEEVLEHGFEKGSGRVGRATVLGEERRMVLAVNAHIRHRLTDYECYLRILSEIGDDDVRAKARERVKGRVMRIANSWRKERQYKETYRNRLQAATCPVKIVAEPKPKHKVAKKHNVCTKLLGGLDDDDTVELDRGKSVRCSPSITRAQRPRVKTSRSRRPRAKKKHRS